MSAAGGGVVVVGDVVTDVVAVLSGQPVPDTDTPAAVRLTGGGQAANTAVWLAWHGVAVTLAATVGADGPGVARVAELRAAGVACPVPPLPGAATGTIIVLVDGVHRTMVTDRGAALRLRPSDVDVALDAAPGARHLHLSAYPLLDAESRSAGSHAIATARERGMTVSVDAASAAPLRRVGKAFLDWVSGCDLLLANADEAEVLAGDGVAETQARALARVTRIAVVKRGAGGAVWADAHGVRTAPAPSVRVVDPTGAGDAFAAALLAAWLAGDEPSAALGAGVAAGAAAVSVVGARPPHR
ncbi:MAG TPA: PfkB family carbohydrate kinase [Asanoa sp.]